MATDARTVTTTPNRIELLAKFRVDGSSRPDLGSIEVSVERVKDQRLSFVLKPIYQGYKRNEGTQMERSVVIEFRIRTEKTGTLGDIGELVAGWQAQEGSCEIDAGKFKNSYLPGVLDLDVERWRAGINAAGREDTLDMLNFAAKILSLDVAVKQRSAERGEIEDYSDMTYILTLLYMSMNGLIGGLGGERMKWPKAMDFETEMDKQREERQREQRR